MAESLLTINSKKKEEYNPLEYIEFILLPEFQKASWKNNFIFMALGRFASLMPTECENVSNYI